MVVSGKVSPPAAPRRRTVPSTTCPESGAVLFQSTTSPPPADATPAPHSMNAAASALTHAASFFTCLHFLSMCLEERRERLVVELPLGVQQPKLELERAPRLLLVEQLDLLDEAVQAQPQSGIGDAVLLGQLLQRPRGQQEPLEEGKVLGAQVVHPPPVALAV